MVLVKWFNHNLNKVTAEGITVEKINAEHAAELVTEYNVKNLPTVILVDNSVVKNFTVLQRSR